MSDFIELNIKSISELDSYLNQPAEIKIKPLDLDKGIQFARWGDMNDFPQLVIEDVNKDPEIKTMLRKSAHLLYGGGIKFGKLGFDAKGNEVLLPLDDSKKTALIKNWLRRSAFNRYLLEAAIDLYYFSNVFPEFVLNYGRTEITRVATRAAETCRYGKYNNKGVIDTLYVSYNWPNAIPGDLYTKTISVLDPWYNTVEQLRNGNKLNYIFPLSEPSPGNNYYQLTDWNSIRTSGWLDFSQEIPKYKKNIIKNQFGVRFVIEINTKYFEWKYEGWANKTESERNQIKADETKKFQDFCTGVDSAGKTITINFIGDGQSNDINLVKFTPIKKLIEKNEYIEDGQQASTMKAIAIGLHPALLGFMPNSGLGGAGSNIREAYNLHVIMNKSKQDLLLEPLYTVRDYNGWGDEVEFAFNNTLMTTLDAGKETTNLKK